MLYISKREGSVTGDKKTLKQNLTITLDQEIVRTLKLLAAADSMSVSDFIARQLEALTYEHSKRQALAMLDQGFNLVGGVRATRDELHERRSKTDRRESDG